MKINQEFCTFFIDVKDLNCAVALFLAVHILIV